MLLGGRKGREGASEIIRAEILCVWVSGFRRATCDIRALFIYLFFFSVYSWKLLVAAREEREVPGALHARDEQGGVLPERETGDVLDRGGRPQQHAF